MTSDKLLTIGQLAKQVNVRTSTLRFYEKEGLLQPNGRSDSGYRLYHPDASQTVHLIQRAQRLGFSLADIRPLLHAWETGNLNDDAVIQTAENRYLALEEQITRQLVQQHELALFLQDLHMREETAVSPHSAFDQLLARVCASPEIQAQAHFMFDWLLNQAGCVLTSTTGQQLLDRLRGQHIHIWQEDDTYHILIVSNDPAVGSALQELAQLEATCEAHSHLIPEFTYNDEGYLFIAKGENAFIYARLFMALEAE
ncbi:MAG: MerR family transcriptional regulator [Anaerolineae bacterium]|nr:MerR family transcriptional regulator [Anaerolineae bacterium]